MYIKYQEQGTVHVSFCYHLPVKHTCQESNDSQGRVEAASGHDVIVPKMTHYLAWDVFLRHTSLVP